MSRYPGTSSKSHSLSSIRTNSRINRLAKPKQPHPDYVEDKPSVNWSDVLPRRRIRGPSKRLLALAKSKRDFSLLDERDSKLPFSIERSVLDVVLTERIIQLAQPKQCHPNYQKPKPATPKVSDGALSYVPSQRIERLAQPRVKPENPDDQSDKKFSPLNIMFEYSKGDISIQKLLDSTRRIIYSKTPDRLSELAQPKSTPLGYEPPKKITTQVPKRALLYTPSQRIIELAKSRKDNCNVSMNEDYMKVIKDTKENSCSDWNSNPEHSGTLKTHTETPHRLSIWP